MDPNPYDAPQDQTLTADELAHRKERFAVWLTTALILALGIVILVLALAMGWWVDTTLVE